MRSYTAHPIQLYTLALPLLLLGSFSCTWGWLIPGAVIFLLGVATGIVIVLAWFWQEHGNYLDRVTSDMLHMERVKDPDVWAVMGYDKPKAFVPTQVQHALPDNNPPQLAYPAPPVSREKLQTFSNAILMGRSMAEGDWGGPGKPMSLPEIRKLKRFLEQHKYIALKDQSHPTQGFVRTKRGTEFFLVYAEQGIRDLFAPTMRDPGSGLQALEREIPTLLG